MTLRQQWAVVGGVVALLALGLFVATRMLGDELFPVSVGSEAPDFSARTLDAAPRTKTMADYQGQVVLLNVWATWCAPCRVEMPAIQALHEAYGPHGLKVVAVSIDDPGKEDAIREFARDYGLSFEILHDAPGDIQRAYQTTGVPETFVIGSDGVIRKKVIGAVDWNSPVNRALVAQLLGVPAAAPAGPSVGDSAGLRDSARAVEVDAAPPGR